MTRISDMTPLTSLPVTGAYVPVEKTGSTTNYRFDLSNLANLNGLFVNAPSFNIATGIDVISTSGADILDHGGANYVAGTAPTSRSGFTSSNGRNFVLSKEQTINPRMFYDATDTDFQNAMQKSFDYLAAIGRAGDGYPDKVAGGLYIPNDKYLLHDTLVSPCAIDINGESTVLGGGSTLKWSGSSGHCLNIRGWDGVSHHGTGSEGPQAHAQGLVRTPGDPRGQARDLYQRQARLRMSSAATAGDRRSMASAIPGRSNGTINLSVFRNIYGENCDLVLKLEGGDGNACVVSGIRGQSNRLGVYWDRGFLGNAARAIHAENNGLDPNFRSRCEKNGHIYVVAYGQEVWCSTNSPTGTATSNLGWKYLNDGPVNAYTATWVTGQTWYFTAPVMVYSGGSTQGSADQCYIEGGQNPIILDAFAKCTTTTTATVMLVDGTLVGGRWSGDGSQMLLNNGVVVPGRSVFSGDVLQFGPMSGAATDLNFNLNATANILVTFNRYNSDGTFLANDGYLQSVGGVIYLTATSGLNFRHNAVSVFTTVAGGLDLPAAKVLSIAGVTAIDASRNGSFVGVTATAGMTSSGGGVGYATGAGGTVTQITSRTTGVTLNKLCGSITLFSAAGQATYQTFTVTNSQVAATDVIRVVQKSGTDKNIILVTAVGAGSFDITFATTGGTTTEQPVFNFEVGKGVSS
jgi:hypothetical protein